MFNNTYQFSHTNEPAYMVMKKMENMMNDLKKDKYVAILNIMNDIFSAKNTTLLNFKNINFDKFNMDDIDRIKEIINKQKHILDKYTKIDVAYDDKKSVNENIEKIVYKLLKSINYYLGKRKTNNKTIYFVSN